MTFSWPLLGTFPICRLQERNQPEPAVPLPAPFQRVEALKSQMTSHSPWWWFPVHLEVTGLLSLAANILRHVWSRTNTCSHAKRKLRAYDSCTELGSASAYLWRNLSSRSTTSLLAARAVGFVAAESLTKIRVQTIQGPPTQGRQEVSCHHSLGATGATLNTRNASSQEAGG